MIKLLLITDNYLVFLKIFANFYYEISIHIFTTYFNKLTSYLYFIIISYYIGIRTSCGCLGL